MSIGNNNNNLQYYKLVLQLISVITVGIITIPFLTFIDFDSFLNENKKSEIVSSTEIKEEKEEIVDGIHLETGLKVDENWQLVKTNCTRCHTATIIINNKFTREGWDDLIVWMQETQGLWKLGTNKDKILDYLAKNYAPEEKYGRRPALNLKKEDWYVLE